MKFLIDMALSPKTVKVLRNSGYEAIRVNELKDPSPEHVNSLLLSAIPRIKDSLDKGSIVLIEDYRIRIRELPIL